MAIQTGGYRLSTMPRVNVDFRVRPIDLSGLGAGFRGGMQQITAGIKERREKDRQGKIRLAAMGDKEAMASLSPADQGFAQEKALEIDLEKKRLEALEADIAATKAATGIKQFGQSVESLIPRITFSETGETEALPEEAALLPESVVNEAVYEAKKRRLETLGTELDITATKEQIAGAEERRLGAQAQRLEDERTAMRNEMISQITYDNKGQMIPTETTQRLQQENPILFNEAVKQGQMEHIELLKQQAELERAEKGARANMQEAFALIKSKATNPNTGVPYTQDDFSGETWSGQLALMAQYEDKPLERMQVFEKDGAKWVEDKVTGEARLLTTDSLERLMYMAGFDAETRRQTAAKLIGAQVAKQTEPETVSVSPAPNVKQDMPKDKANIYNEINSMMSATDKIVMPGQEGFNMKSVFSNEKTLKQTRLNIFNMLQRVSNEDLAEMIDTIAKNPEDKEFMNNINEMFGDNVAQAIYLTYRQAEETEE